MGRCRPGVRCRLWTGPAWPGLLLAILAITGAVWWPRNEAKQKKIHRNIKTWEDLEKKVHPRA